MMKPPPKTNRMVGLSSESAGTATGSYTSMKRSQVSRWATM